MASVLAETGVPYDVAWAIADCSELQAHALAWIVLYGERQGGDFDWNRLKWKDKNDK